MNAEDIIQKLSDAIHKHSDEIKDFDDDDYFPSGLIVKYMSHLRNKYPEEFLIDGEIIDDRFFNFCKIKDVNAIDLVVYDAVDSLIEICQQEA